MGLDHPTLPTLSTHRPTTSTSTPRPSLLTELNHRPEPNEHQSGGRVTRMQVKTHRGLTAGSRGLIDDRYP